MADRWTPESLAADKVRINGQIYSPGLVRFRGLKQTRDFRVTDFIVGISGGMVQFRGRKLCRFGIDFLLHTEEDWSDYYTIKPILDELPYGRGPDGATNFGKAVGLEHPLLSLLNISAVVLEHVGVPEQDGDKGVWKVALECIEFRRPRLQTASVDAAKSAPPDPTDVIIQSLTDRVKDMWGKYGASGKPGVK